MTIKRIVFWEPCASPHKHDLFNSLATVSPDIEIICCADADIPAEREALGWVLKETSHYKMLIKPPVTEIENIISNSIEDTLHILSGIRWFPTIVNAIKIIKKKNARFAIMSEPRVSEGWKGKLRLLQSWIEEAWYRRNAEFVLGIGLNGPAWFLSVGYPEKKIFPFAYFIDPPSMGEISLNDQIHATSPLKIGFAGRLVKTKGVYNLVKAVEALGPNVILHIVGDGPELEGLQKKCKILNINAVFHGVLPMPKMGAFMGSLDVLVLASTSKDGWGVCISEALMCGTAAVATASVGASLVLNDPLLGKHIRTSAPFAIADAVNCLSEKGAFTAIARKRRMRAAYAKLSSKSGAAYFLNIVQWSTQGGKRPQLFDK